MMKSIEEMTLETILGEYGIGKDRKRMLGSDFETVQTRVNQYYNIADECTRGIWGFGWNRKNALEGAGYDPTIVQLILDRDYAERLDFNGC